MRMLVVDDEPEMLDLLVRGLTEEGHEVLAAPDGVAAIGLANTEPLDFAVVDVMLPGMSGFELCRRMKEHDSGVAVMLLTARDAVDDRVRGLDAGADDYLTKPFAFAELAARVRAIRRRDALGTPTRIRVGGLDIDLPRHRVSTGPGEVRLSRTEFDVLRVLALHARSTVSRGDLLAEVWQTERHIDPNVVDQYVSYLRRKLAAAAVPARIRTVRGAGFVLMDGPDD